MSVFNFHSQHLLAQLPFLSSQDHSAFISKIAVVKKTLNLEFSTYCGYQDLSKAE